MVELMTHPVRKEEYDYLVREECIGMFDGQLLRCRESKTFGRYLLTV
jgi:hypothetical protein